MYTHFYEYAHLLEQSVYETSTHHVGPHPMVAPFISRSGILLKHTKYLVLIHLQTNKYSYFSLRIWPRHLSEAPRPWNVGVPTNLDVL